MWKEIITEADIEELLQNYGNFHDSCLRDIHISTREFVDERLAMHFENKNVATLLFQRQFDKNTILELKFEDVYRFNFHPFQPDYNGVIYDATLKKGADIFYWADEQEWEIGDEDANWISAKKVYWRYRPELRGNVTRLKEE
ncbi:hypothetical protein ACD591_21160 [Rufibacter glacialis]|uniref:Uncharacterized protein n=1 Tax=Rufibacter glacialis TaxID=1259555 RepID=A0A5M8QS07_9BACT|nr:hypothetical protein [Rufibacter glacialis]KAA6438011.1 hypothetical protein FOE74_00830 [Rufibacter glacialis]GGK89644.1 hypothetical protein GCM10011405_41690 [Rufibacter glacialis]